MSRHKTTHFWFLADSDDDRGYLDLYKEVPALVHVVEASYYLKHFKIDDRLLKGRLPPNAQKVLGPELRPGLFETTLYLEDFFVLSHQNGLIYLGVLR